MHIPTTLRLPRRSTEALLALAAATSLLPGCDNVRAAETGVDSYYEAEGSDVGTWYGPAVSIGNGTGRTYVTMAGNAVREIGLALTESALQGLPDGPGHAGGHHEHFNAWELPMHPQNPTPVKYAVVNWNSQGHEPEEIYGLPHFDFHFYLITPAEVAAIHPSQPDFMERANRLPPAELIPANYISTHEFMPGAAPADATVPLMGLHWSDITSPELAGATFTETFVYGSYGPDIIFLEPMVTRAFLETRPNLRRTLPVAARGYNPGSYRVFWHADRGEYRIALTDLPQGR